MSYYCPVNICIFVLTRLYIYNLLFSSGDEIEKRQSVKISSPQDLESYPSLSLFDNLEPTIIKILRKGDLNGHTIKSKVLWHVIKNSNFLINLKSLDDKSDCSIDAAQKMKFSIKDFFSKCDQIRL